MKIIEIAPLDNGAHRNQSSDGKMAVPDGWAVIPDTMEIPDTFPFVNVEVDGQTVTSMTAGTVPEPEPEPDPQPTLESRVTNLETTTAEQEKAINALLTGEG